ncbi:cobyrinic acid a,c-diamide synthase [Marinobacter halodurans]|uniref:Cobyrinic acid a,c-diamide synthase n=1 Tax=Marinobacter halodurans TaxID=2528979 RepID=A0ABY1ZMV4_9GAMM|nr:AAA family ATPase [Marinobacter halodurans]TBW57489.1 cobyrinic acid a,c-diamide synthase [Marinobacter halodurans]
MQSSGRWLGPGERSYEYFSSLNQKGLSELDDIRDEINKEYGDGHHRRLRTWGAQQAAEMVGRSTQWLRDFDPDVYKNEAGHGRWTLERIDQIREQAGTKYIRPKGSQPITIAMSKFKGGVGNTTNACHVIHALAMKGLKVLAVDFEPQASLTQILGGIVPDLHLEDEDLPVEALLKDPELILDPDSRAVRGTYFHNVDLMPANSSFQDFEIQLLSQHFGNDDSNTDVSPQNRLAAVLDLIKDNYDVIIIDCPPSLGLLTMNGLAAADGIITSLKPELLDRASLVAYTDALAGYTSMSEKEFKYFRLLISQYQDSSGQDRVTSGSGHRRNEIAVRRVYGDAVMDNIMYHSRAIADASTSLSTVLGLEKPVGSRGAYKRAVGVIASVCDEIFQDLNDIWTMEADGDE